MTDYSNACVYKIICKVESITDIYIGSTVNFKRRRYGHKNCCTNPNIKDYNLKVYKFIRDNGGWDNWQMIKICDVKCLDGYYLRKKEGEYIRNLNPTLNKNIAGRSRNETIKVWNLKNRKKIRAYQKAYDLKNRDKKKAYRIKNKDKRKAYDLKNRDKINKQRRERRAKKKLLKSKEII